MVNELLVVGQIVKTHGVRGEVKVLPMTDDVMRFKKLKKVFIDGEEKVINGCKFQSKRVILKISGIDTIEEAEKYKNKYLEIEREDAAELSEGHYYIADIIGCNVFDTDNKELGKVYDVIETGSNDVYWVKGGEEEVLIPALKDIVVDIDVCENKIIIKPVDEWS